MARSTDKSGTRLARPSRATAPVRFVNEDASEDGFDEIESGEEDKDDIQPPFSKDVLQGHQERKTKKSSPQTPVFQNQKKAIYATARKNAIDVSKSGTAYIENTKAEIRELKTPEVSYDKYLQDFERLCIAQKKSIDLLMSSYPPLLDDLATRRSGQINTASEMIKRNPTRRQTALKRFSKNARVRVEEARENERTATDASALIKHYKNLLYA